MPLYLFLPMHPMSVSDSICKGLYIIRLESDASIWTTWTSSFTATGILGYSDLLTTCSIIHQLGTGTINIVISQMEEGVALKSGWNL